MLRRLISAQNPQYPYSHLLSPTPDSPEEKWRNKNIPAVFTSFRDKKLSPQSLDGAVRKELDCLWEIESAINKASEATEKTSSDFQRALRMTPKGSIRKKAEKANSLRLSNNAVHVAQTHANTARTLVTTSLEGTCAQVLDIDQQCRR